MINRNKSPVVHLQHNLGLESWCVKHVFSYAQQKIIEVKRLVAKRKLLYEEYDNLNRLLVVGLLINPDVTTFWNLRRELVCDKYLDRKEEFKFTRLVLSHKAKSNEAFGYRRFLLQKLMGGRIDKEPVWYMLTNEFVVCTLSCQKASNNYHAWNHRIWCMENILGHYLCDDIRGRIIDSELNNSEKWVQEHVSEHTGFHYRQYVINYSRKYQFSLSSNYFTRIIPFLDDFDGNSDFFIYLFGCPAQKLTDTEYCLLYQNTVILLYELFCNNLIDFMYIDHETIWNHRRFILFEIFSNMYKYLGLPMYKPCNLDLLCDKRENNIVANDLGEKLPKILKREEDFVQTSNLYKILVRNERELIEKHSKCQSWEGHLAKRHGKWLTYILGVPDL